MQLNGVDRDGCEGCREAIKKKVIYYVLYFMQESGVDRDGCKRKAIKKKPNICYVLYNVSCNKVVWTGMAVKVLGGH